MREIARRLHIATMVLVLVVLFGTVVIHAIGGGRWTWFQSLFHTVITLSTVGYGDVLPITGAVRLIAVIEVIFGVTLLLVGFSEIMSYSREVEARRRGAPAAREETNA